MSHESLDEKIVKKKSIPAQVVLWIVIIGLLFLAYKAFSGHPSGASRPASSQSL